MKTLDGYQEATLRTWRQSLPELTEQEYFVLTRALSVATIVGKHCDAVKKAIFHGKGGIANVAKQMTDSASYVASLMHCDDMTYGEKAEVDPEILNHMRSIIGVFGEAAEVADLVLEADVSGDGVSHADMQLELGDCLYYVAVGSHGIGCNLSEVADANIAKLIIRHPSGFQLPLAAEVA